MPETQLKCTKGNAMFKGMMMGQYERPMILTGKRRKWDSLHWSLFQNTPNGYEVSLQGLYRGNYCDAKCLAKDLYRVMIEHGMTQSAESLARACAANGEDVKN